MVSDRKTLIGGLAMLGFAGFYGFFASGLNLQSSLGMGPGFFPLALSGILGFLGLLLTIQAVASSAITVLPMISWRGLLLISAAPVLFSLLVWPLGALPALAVALLVGGMASRRSTWLSALVSTIVLVLFCALVFGFGLGITITFIGPWLRF